MAGRKLRVGRRIQVADRRFGMLHTVRTKNGRPVSRLVPYREKPKSLFGIDRRKIEIVGNVVEPVDTVWEVETGNTWDGDV